MNTNPHLGPDTEFLKIMRESVGSVVQISVSQLLVFENRRKGFGRALDLIFEPLMETLVARVRPPDIVLFDQ